MAIETHDVALQTLDGLRLDGDLAVPSGQVSAGVVVCHPHPRFGGDRFNSVVDALFRGLAEAGCLVLRFDFRGVNGSEGVHGDGVDERIDAAAAIDGHDQFSPPDATAVAVAAWRNTHTTVLPSADHFLAGHLAQVVAWASACATHR